MLSCNRGFAQQFFDIGGWDSAFFVDDNKKAIKVFYIDYVLELILNKCMSNSKTPFGK